MSLDKKSVVNDKIYRMTKRLVLFDVSVIVRMNILIKSLSNCILMAKS